LQKRNGTPLHEPVRNTTRTLAVSQGLLYFGEGQVLPEPMADGALEVYTST
jgi:hypothetical protein